MDKENEFFRVKLLDLLPDTTLTFDLYMYLAHSKKMIPYRKAGQKFERGKKKYFEEKNFDQLYVHTSDREKFIAYTANQMNQVMAAEDLKPAERLAKLQSATTAYLDEFFSNDNVANVDDQIDICKDMIRTVVVQLSEENIGELYSTIETLAEKNKNLSDHLFNVSTFATMFALGIGFSGEEDILSLSMAGLYHASGLLEIDEFVASRFLAGDQLPADEIKIFKRHIKASIEILETNNSWSPPKAREIISQYMENYDGSGIPLGLKGKAINKLASILRIACDFNLLLKKRKVNPTPAVAIRKILFGQKYSFGKKYDDVLLMKIVDLLKISKRNILENEQNLDR